MGKKKKMNYDLDHTDIINYINRIFEIEHKKQLLKDTVKEQIKELNQDQKPFKEELGFTKIKVLEIIQMIFEKNPDKKFDLVFFENVFNDWLAIAREKDEHISSSCLKNWNCGRLFQKKIVEEVEEKYNIKILS